MGNFWRGAAEVGNALYDYVGDKKKWELADTTNELQRMKAEKLKSDIEEGKVENEALKGISPYTTQTTNQITDLPKDESVDLAQATGQVEGGLPEQIQYGVPQQQRLTTQSTQQIRKPIHRVQEDVGLALIGRGQGKLGQIYLANAARERETHFNNLVTNLSKMGEWNPDVANEAFAKSPEYAELRDSLGYKEGTRLNFQKGELEGQFKLPFDYTDPRTGVVYPKDTMVDMSWKGNPDPFAPGVIPTKIKPVGSNRSESVMDLIKKANPDASPQELLDLAAEREITVAGRKAEMTRDAAEDFKNWPDEIKQQAFERRLAGEKPQFGGGMQGQMSYKQFEKEYNQWALDRFGPGGASSTKARSYLGSAKSLDLQIKQRDAMESFVENIRLQTERVPEIMKSIARVDARLLNIPIKEVRKRIVGQADENILSMYLTEISNEAAKISTGSQASIRELSESAQVKWAKIHDEALSPTETLKLLQETNHLGQMRLQTVNKTINNIQNTMNKTIQGKAKTVPTPSPSPKTVVERRKTADGRILVEYSDGTRGEEK